MPNQEIMKFKKAHNTLYSAISELVNSDKYYLNGDLGVRADGELVHEGKSIEEARKFFCQTLADVLNSKSVNCSGMDAGKYLTITTNADGSKCSGTNGEIYNNCIYPPSAEYLNERKNALDTACKTLYLGVNDSKQIIMPDGVVYYDMSLTRPFSFGITGFSFAPLVRYFASPDPNVPSYRDINGLGGHYRVLCMDIDGIPDNATKDSCVNECPFGYGIRADGKVLNGKRAEEWLEKSIQEK